MEGQSDDWRTVLPEGVPPMTEMKLQREWFKMGFYVYVVVLVYRGAKYFYVGMTGDKAHSTARSPFYRMAGHFTLTERSTQNQIIRGIKKLVDAESEISEVLQEMDITYYAWLTNDYVRDDAHEYRLRRRCAERIESSLIEKMWREYPGCVFNKNVSSVDHADAEETAELIFKDLKRKMS